MLTIVMDQRRFDIHAYRELSVVMDGQVILEMELYEDAPDAPEVHIVLKDYMNWYFNSDGDALTYTGTGGE